jgi:uncharacterized Zn finger protein
MSETITAWCPHCGRQTDKAKLITALESNTGEALFMDCLGCGKTGIVVTWDPPKAECKECVIK